MVIPHHIHHGKAQVFNVNSPLYKHRKVELAVISLCVCLSVAMVVATQYILKYLVSQASK